MNDLEYPDLNLEKLRQAVLDVSHQKEIQLKILKQPYSFDRQYEKKKFILANSFDSNKQVEILQAGDYLKLLCHQKRSLSKRQVKKISQLNESLKIDQQNFKYLFMIITQANYYKLQYPGYYERLLQQQSKYPQSMFSIIEKDVHRTFQQQKYQKRLKNVLIAFAIRRPQLLYCQGINYVVAYFLLNNISQEESFWILIGLIQNVLPDDYYKDLRSISIIVQIFSDIMLQLFPDMGRQMNNIGLDCSLFIVSWYVCLFTKGFINSVSSYLLSKLILQTKTHSFSFVILKLSLGIIASILGRDEPFTFRPQPEAFRDKFQISVLEISLLEIKLGIQYVQLNEQNFLRLEKYYKDKRQERHMQNLQKDLRNKRLFLPICKDQYPICLHRIQIERKIGNISQVTINKNGYQISDQYIGDYFNKQPKKQLLCMVCESIDDCLMYRKKHLCGQDLLGYHDSNDLSWKLQNALALRHDESFILQQEKMGMFQECESSKEIQIKPISQTDDEKLKELSGFFVIDKNFQFCSQEQIEENWSVNLSQVLNQTLAKPASSSSLDESFSLEKQLKKNQINQDKLLEKEEINSVNIQGPRQNSIDKMQNRFQQKNKNQIGQKSESFAQICDESVQKSFFNKQKIRNFFQKTWKKVTKIKEEELKK